MTYTIEVTNEGTKATTGSIIVTDTLEPVFTFVSISGTGWVCDTTMLPDITCTHPGPLAPGDPPLVLTLVVTLNPPGAFIVQNTAMVTTEDDSDADNNSDTFIFNLAERTAPVLSIAGLGALIALLTFIAYVGLNRLRMTSKDQ